MGCTGTNTVESEKEKHEHGAGTVKKVAMVDFCWHWFVVKAANTVIHSAKNPSLIYSCIVI